MGCCETNPEGNIDFGEFTGRYVEPSKAIGFNLAVLLTNLSEHMPNDPRLAKFLESAGTGRSNFLFKISPKDGKHINVRIRPKMLFSPLCCSPGS